MDDKIEFTLYIFCMGRVAFTDDEIASIRERICLAALKLFAANGHAAVTMRAISAEIQTSPMTPYRYFPGGKREILAAARTDAFRRFADKQEAVLSGGTVTETSEGSVDLIERMGLAYVGFALEDPASFRIMFEMEPPAEDEFPELAIQAERARKPVLDAVERAIDEGQFAGEPKLVTQVLWAGLHGLVALHLAGQLQHGYQLTDLLPYLTATLRVGTLAKDNPLSGQATLKFPTGDKPK